MGGRGAGILARIESARKVEEGERFRRLGSVGPETGAGRAYLCFGRCEKCEFRTRNLLFCEKKFTFIVNLTG